MKREPPAQLTMPAQLLVEGSDPMNLLRVFCRSWHLPGIQIHDFGGVTELRDYLKSLRGISGYDGVMKLGIIRDAEQSARSAFESIQHSLQDAALDIPEEPRTASSGRPAVSVLILPDGVSEGSLESLLWQSVEADPRARCIDDYVACMELQNMTVARSDKVRVLAWLAAQRRPTDSIGVAARMRRWDPMHQSFADMRLFLEELTAEEDAT